MIPLTLVAYVSTLWKSRQTVKYAKDVGQTVSAKAREKTLHQAKETALRYCCMMFGFCIEVIMVKALEGLVCETDNDGTLRLSAELDQVRMLTCF